MSTAPRFLVTLEATTDVLDRPPAVRLRTLLKIAGRGLGLRAIRVEPIDDDPEATAAPVAATPTAAAALLPLPRSHPEQKP